MKKYNIVLIRALACIAVILYHMNNMMFGIGGTTSSLLAIGGIAPYFFFCDKWFSGIGKKECRRYQNLLCETDIKNLPGVLSGDCLQYFLLGNPVKLELAG